MFGPAGSGKSAFANMIAQRLDVGSEVDLTYYRCERGDPVLSNPGKLLATIAYRIACKHGGYRSRLLGVLSQSNRTPTAFYDVRERYQQLLGYLIPNVTSPSRPHVMVIGGLDACGDALDNGKLVARILNLAKVVP